MDSPSILGSAVNSTGASASSLRKRRMRATKSATSSSAKALPSDSMGTAWRTLPNAFDRRRADAPGRAVGPHQLGKARLDRRVALAQGVIVGIGDLGRVLPVVELVVPGDLAWPAARARLSPRSRSARQRAWSTCAAPSCRQSCLHTEKSSPAAPLPAWAAPACGEAQRRLAPAWSLWERRPWAPACPRPAAGPAPAPSAPRPAASWSPVSAP